jgi:hypothetical protein
VKKSLTIGALGAGSLASVLVAAPAVAATEDILADAVTSLQNGASYVAPGTTGPGPAGFDGSDIAVVVAPVNGADTLTPVQLASQIQSQLGNQYETVIVVNTDTTSGQAYGVVPGESSAAILPILNGGRGVENLNDNQAEVLSAVGKTETSTVANQPAGDSFNGAAVVGAGGGLLGAVLVGTLAIVMLKRHKNRVRPITTRAIKRVEMRDAMEKLGELTEKHAAKRYATAKPMASILAHLNELFSRLERKGVENQKNLAEVEYSDTLKKLNNALGSDYYLDIAGNGNLWDRGDERLREVEAAVRAVDEQILLNIRQVNSSKDLDFRVALGRMLSSVDQPSATEMIQKPERRLGH